MADEAEQGQNNDCQDGEVRMERSTHAGPVVEVTTSALPQSHHNQRSSNRVHRAAVSVTVTAQQARLLMAVCRERAAALVRAVGRRERQTKAT